VPSPVPTPVAAAIGIVPAVVAHARRLPGKAVQLPVFAVSSALTALDTVRREYGDLVERGEQLLARLRGMPLEEFEDIVQDVAAHSPFAGAYDGVQDPLDVARTRASTIGATVAGAAARAGGRVENAADAVVGTAQDAARAGAAAAAKTTAAAGAGSKERALPAHGTLVDAQAPKGAATAKATEPDSTRVDSAATPDVVEMADAVAAFSDVPEVGSHDELPLPDYDHMTLGSLRGSSSCATTRRPTPTGCRSSRCWTTASPGSRPTPRPRRRRGQPAPGPRAATRAAARSADRRRPRPAARRVPRSARPEAVTTAVRSRTTGPANLRRH
jgi:hypothetical protein